MRGSTAPTSSDEGAAPPRRPADRIRTVVLTVAGAIGLTCLLAWAAVAFTGLSFVVVTTGSMAPTIPAGGLAITHRVPAAEITDGDVVTVPRAGSALPVTHRVVAVDRVPGTPRRGRSPCGATTTPPTTATRTSSGTPDSCWRTPPAWARHLVVVTSAPARGLAVALVGVLVAWAFWPARREDS
ncbi:S26 family signal peptidase [Sphingomonas sp. LR61]|uniref:S26 family signal peptidase n=1 Tax=Sphingomonas sp. LR61 TaxID=3050234 RepID=UPI002FE09EDC